MQGKYLLMALLVAHTINDTPRSWAGELLVPLLPLTDLLHGLGQVTLLLCASTANGLFKDKIRSNNINFLD